MRKSTPSATILVYTALAVGSIAATTAWSAIPRDDDAILISGSMVPDLIGEGILDIGVHRWDPALQVYVPVPFQVDEVVDKVFNPGTPYQFTERMYDVEGIEDGEFDANDEIALLWADAGGVQAPSSAPWPAGVADRRYELRIDDPRPGATPSTRWVYLFEGSGLPRSPNSYVTWSGTATSSMLTERFQLDFTDRWLLTGYRVLAPCGSGLDLIDRGKGRAQALAGVWEDEERWNQGSSFLGGIAGPVRSIRYIRGATSGVNTIHHDVIYRGAWIRSVNLRVHPLPEIRLYIDWRPTPVGARIYTPLARDGVPLDGVNDPSIASAWVDWNVVSHPDGGMVLLLEVPPSALFTGRFFQYKDDASYDDAIPTNPTYADEDHASYGSHGIRLTGLSDSQLQAIAMTLRLFPTCGGVGDATLGDEYQAFLDFPLQVSAAPQWRTAQAVRALVVEREGSDLELDWPEVQGATTFRVYVSTAASLPRGQWTLAGETASTEFLDVGAASSPEPRYYSVVGVGAGGEGPW